MLQPRGFPDTRPSLLDALCDGSREVGWRTFFELYAPAVYRVARLRGLSDPDAEDIVQQVMMAVARHIEAFTYDRDRGRFRDWVRRVTDSRVCDLFRRKRPERQNEAALATCVDETVDIAEHWRRAWRLQDLYFCLEEIAKDISPRRMQAFRMYALEGKSAVETAKTVGMKVSYVYLTRHQVLNMIRERMERLAKREAES
ncbi:MAG: sigma-70 family RNA polymerase sigma factor [Phycisphaerales bacterium]|nr:sigma-70 family RNA polymerase sigma factor [Phycisphaerales bacterium]